MLEEPNLKREIEESGFIDRSTLEDLQTPAKPYINGTVINGATLHHIQNSSSASASSAHYHGANGTNGVNGTNGTNGLSVKPTNSRRRRNRAMQKATPFKLGVDVIEEENESD
eukprot:CAMPEP_0116575342 /NCGR_PEP_ID=MMETSP0397-20121206/19903_1 /TAXON_ID=216820 /ORGANISM="Cyclophora tenuis, Strain ECT3854" /LENGTH=112 /DNA_ID=CAMNT_0004104221 /DNA_START=233 /DNA_END=568 /DNA_ORIENTATION=-